MVDSAVENHDIEELNLLLYTSRVRSLEVVVEMGRMETVTSRDFLLWATWKHHERNIGTHWNHTIQPYRSHESRAISK